MQKKYQIYGSGDRGTLELRAIFTDLEVPHSFVDIRVNQRGHDPLLFLVSQRLITVPQVFDPDGGRVGDFEATIRHLDSLVEQIG
jgi:hypothetical protein